MNERQETTRRDKSMMAEKDKVITLEVALDDVEARFLYNLPDSELAQAERLFFQIEQAWWFYEDFMADKFDHLPHFKSLKIFAETIFKRCPLLSKIQHKCDELFNEFGAYKDRIPVFGCILLNNTMKKIALCNSWSGKSWGFPRGKVNEGETQFECAIRETFEETGFDAVNYCREEDAVVVMSDEKVIKLFIATKVPEDTVFEPQTRKEVSKVEFHSLDNLPPNCFGIYPFLPKIRRWISTKGRCDSAPKGKGSGPSGGRNSATPTRNPSSKKERKKTTTTPINSAPSSSSTTTTGVGASMESTPERARRPKDATPFDARNKDTFAEDVSTGAKGWDVASMFATNAKLTGRSYQYDGNPQAFGSSHPRYVDYSQSTSPGPAMRVQSNFVPNNQTQITIMTKLSSSSSSSSHLPASLPPRPPSTSTSTSTSTSAPQPTTATSGKKPKLTLLSRMPPAQPQGPPSDHKKFATTAQPRASVGRPGLECHFAQPFLLDKASIMAALDSVLGDPSIMTSGDLLLPRGVEVGP